MYIPIKRVFISLLGLLNLLRAHCVVSQMSIREMEHSSLDLAAIG